MIAVAYRPQYIGVSGAYNRSQAPVVGHGVSLDGELLASWIVPSREKQFGLRTLAPSIDFWCLFSE